MVVQMPTAFLRIFQSNQQIRNKLEVENRKDLRKHMQKRYLYVINVHDLS